MLYFSYQGGTWMGDMNYGSNGHWRLVVKADLSLRQDTGTINSSPTVEVAPVIELKYGSSHHIVLLGMIECMLEVPKAAI